MLRNSSQIQSLVFDLDGTLYKSDGLAKEIQTMAAALVADTRGVSLKEGRMLLQKSKQRLMESLEQEPTLTQTCQTLGIEVAEFHRAMQQQVRPERYLDADPILQALLESLAEECNLYLYTNNSLPMTEKILALLGIESLFRRLYTIEFSWTPKPDSETLQRVLEDIGGPPESFLFVGDREQIDLKVPRTLGIPTLLVTETADLLQIHQILGIIP
jgi:putative hydrolase of the HAD superfamily